MKRIGIFGGTFDPIHEGHLRLIRAARTDFRLDRIYLVPSYLTPLKDHRAQPARHRTAMIRAGIRGISFARLSLVELKRKGVSYSIETVRYFRRRLGPSAQLYFLAGSDVLPRLNRWRKIRKLLNLCQFAVAGRPRFPKRLTKRLSAIFMKPFPVSSSEIRDRLRRGQSVRGLVPPPVIRYIKRHRLYLSD